MPGAVTRSGPWRIKPSSRLPIFLRFVINSSFTTTNARKSGFKHVLANRTYLNYMMYWPAKEYDPFEREIVGYASKKKGWVEWFCNRELRRAEFLERLGRKLRKVDWSKKTNRQLIVQLKKLIGIYNSLVCPWYTQYSLDEYFEGQVTEKLAKYVHPTDPRSKHYVQVFTDPKDMTEVAWERYDLLKIAQKTKERKIKLSKLPPAIQVMIKKHVERYGYINRGLATGKAYSYIDIIKRLKEVLVQNIDELLRHSSREKLVGEYKKALKEVKPDQTFRHIITQARLNSFLRNRRVEGFFYVDWGASGLYMEIARRTKFNPDLIMEVSPDEMIAGLRGRPMPSKSEMKRRLKGYAMIVRNAKTILITDPKKLKQLERKYYVSVSEGKKELQGMVACRGYGKGRARVFMDAIEMERMQRGDILVAQFTTPDFVPAMEKAAAIVTDQGGVSSHAAIVSRELGVPCVIGTQEATRLIKEGDLIEVDAEHGIVKILGQSKK